MTTLKCQVKAEEVIKGPEEKETRLPRGGMWCPRSQGKEGKGTSCATGKLTKMKECEVPFFSNGDNEGKGEPWAVAGWRQKPGPRGSRREWTVWKRR